MAKKQKEEEQMTNEYEFWDVVVKDLEAAVGKADAELKVNSFLLNAAQNKRARYPNPKEKKQ